VFTTLVSPVSLRETFYLTYMSYTRPRVSFFKGNDTGHFSYILRESQRRVKLIGQANKPLLLVERTLCPKSVSYVSRNDD